MYLWCRAWAWHGWLVGGPSRSASYLERSFVRQGRKCQVRCIYYPSHIQSICIFIICNKAQMSFHLLSLKHGIYLFLYFYHLSQGQKCHSVCFTFWMVNQFVCISICVYKLYSDRCIYFVSQLKLYLSRFVIIGEKLKTAKQARWHKTANKISLTKTDENMMRNWCKSHSNDNHNNGIMMIK